MLVLETTKARWSHPINYSIFCSQEACRGSNYPAECASGEVRQKITNFLCIFFFKSSHVHSHLAFFQLANRSICSMIYSEYLRLFQLNLRTKDQNASALITILNISSLHVHLFPPTHPDLGKTQRQCQLSNGHLLFAVLHLLHSSSNLGKVQV